MARFACSKKEKTVTFVWACGRVLRGGDVDARRSGSWMCKGTEHREEPGSRGVSAARLGEEPRESSEVKGSGFSSVGAHCFEHLEQAQRFGQRTYGQHQGFYGADSSGSVTAVTSSVWSLTRS